MENTYHRKAEAGPERSARRRAVSWKRSLAVITLSATAASGCASMRTDPRSVVEAKFVAVNRHAVADIVALYASDAVISASDFCQPRQGRAGVQRTYLAIFRALPDAVVDVREYLTDGDRVAVRFVLRSATIGPTFQVAIMGFFTVRDGLIVRDDGIFDNRARPCSP